MIIKRRSKPLVLQKLEALNPRLAFNGDHKLRRQLNQETSKEYKGYIGERKVDYFLDILANHTTILQGVCLQGGNKNFQIDTIVITDHALFCIESKNFGDTVTFDTILKQFTRGDGKQQKGYRYPITQAETQQYLLMNWLQEHNLHGIPIHYFVAISEPSTIVKVIGNQEQIAKVVVHAELLPKRIMASTEKIAKDGAAKISGYQIGKKILRHCIEQDFDILGKFSIDKSNILSGVQCPKCATLGMERLFGKWKCIKCDHKSKYAHKRAISDYLLLFGSSITNEDCREFLQVDSRALATRLLKANGLVFQKERKNWVSK